MDIQDPLRLRLMSHLQCFAAQRELASKQTTSTSWGYNPTTQHYPLNPIPTSPNHPTGNNLIGNLPPTHQPPPPPLPTTLQHQSNVQDLNSHFDISTSCAQSTAVPSSSESLSRHSTSTSVLTPLTTTTSSALGYAHHQYPNLNSFSTIPTSSSSLPHIQNYNQNNSSVNMKPYRPWGAEVAY